VTDLDPSATPGVGRPEEITGREADDATDLVDATEAADATDPAVWRGVAAEDAEAMSGAVADLLRSRSRRLAADLFGPHRRALIVLGVVIVVNQVAVLCVPWLVDYGIDHGIPSLEHHGAHRGLPLALTITAVVVAAGIQAVTFRAFILRSGRIGAAVLYELRVRLFAHFGRLSLGFHERYTSGRVISRLTSDMDAINDLFEEGIQSVVVAVLSSLTCSVAMILLDPVLGLIAVASLPVVVVIANWYRKAAARAYRATRETVALVIVQFVESLGGIRAVQAFRREPRNQAIFRTVNDRYRGANAETMRLLGIFMPALTELGYVVTSLVLLVGADRVLHHQTEVGVLAAMYLYLNRFYAPLQDLAQFTNLLQGAAAAVEKVAGVLEEVPDVAEPGQHAGPGLQAGLDDTAEPANRGDLTAPEAARPTLSPRSAGGRGARVELRGVRFTYREGREPVIGRGEPFDLVVPAGQTVAVVGRTGAGKSTVARLMARFYDPSEGRILLDEVDLRDLTDARLRSRVITVTQESFLFAGSVADNIGFSRPGAARPAIEAAARSIGAEGFIQRLPQGYDTDVRKRGGRLSAGQRQLISFARAALADPAVLVLDEATSSLDLPSERLVQRALATLLADRTAVIIAHRLSTVEIADRVIVVDYGRIVEDGSPEDLRRRGGHYARLYDAWQESVARTA
jgi:ATP-binding cassette subfamily B protein